MIHSTSSRVLGRVVVVAAEDAVADTIAAVFSFLVPAIFVMFVVFAVSAILSSICHICVVADS